MKQAHRWIVLLGAFALSACGGGGSSSSTPPPPMTYTIGGTVAGMTASSGLVLQDNGGNNLTVPSDGTFTFSEPVDSGAAYAVTVATQPSGESCSVTSGSGTASVNVTSVAVSCTSVFANGANVASVSVGTFPSDVMQDVFNVPIVTVTVCDATTKCAPIQVMVDTGSSGLRLMSSAISAAGLALAPEGDPNHVGNDLFECAYYADGYAWGGVYTAAQIKIADETAADMPVQVIDTGSPTVPTTCVSSSPGGNNPLNSPNAFSADGVLGIGVAAQDCGTACTTSAIYYYSCPAGGCAAGTGATTVSVADQVANPVIDFATDKNGVILQLPTVGANGAVNATGYLAFGIGTETDNGIGNATILPISGTQPQDQQPLYVNTNFNGVAENGIIDSGSNAYFFAASSIPTCTDATSFYCPTTTQSLTATNSGGTTSSQVAFQVANLDTLHTTNPTFYAFNNVGGPFPEINGMNYFDWGLPFFYGRTVYTIIEGETVGGQAYANGGFAY